MSLSFYGNLPFQLEPYRVVVGIVLALWVASLFVDPSVQLQATGFEGLLACLLVVTLASVALNPGRVAPLQADVAKAVVFFVSFLLFYYLVASTVRSWADIDLLIKLLVGTASILGLLALIQYRTGHSYFNELDKVVPLRRVLVRPTASGVRIRAQGSAQHPIAFGVLMITLMPLCIYLVRKYGKRWYVAPFMLTLGALASVSRTAIVMLVAAAAAIVWIRPRGVVRLRAPTSASSRSPSSWSASRSSRPAPSARSDTSSTLLAASRHNRARPRALRCPAGALPTSVPC